MDVYPILIVPIMVLLTIILIAQQLSVSRYLCPAICVINKTYSYDPFEEISKSYADLDINRNMTPQR